MSYVNLYSMVIALIVKVAYMNARDMREGHEGEDMACMWHEDDKHNIEEERYVYDGCNCMLYGLYG